MKIKCAFIPLCLVVSISFPALASAASYYEGKVLTVIVPYSPGGGYDRMARVLARYLPKYIPGKPAVIVQNMPGAASMIGANYLYGQAKPDGFTIGTIARSSAFSQLVKSAGVKFDLNRFSWIGSTCTLATVLYLRSDLPYKTFDDVLKAKDPIYLASSGVTLVDTYFPQILCEYVGLKAKIIQYTGASECNLAIERKEVDGRAGTYSSAKPLISTGVARAVLRGVANEPGTEKLPVNIDYTTNETARTLMKLISLPDSVAQPYVAPPGTPEPVMEILRNAFAKWAKDPAVIQDADKLMLTPEYHSAEETLKVSKYILSQPESMIKELKKYIEF